WRLRGGYTYLNEQFEASSPGVVPGSDDLEALDPHNEVSLQSMMQLPGNVQFDLMGRWVDSLPGSTFTATPETPAYFSLDAKLAWQYKNWEFSLVGQNLLEDHHREFGAVEIPRSFYGKVAVNW
ncbi:MAG TPA: hypothetical protein VHY37_03485, partial [Tepidisphaeraceae bacterium]|nr:hypothetical protein [Tepidisphaeraceae bacterium]